MSRLHSGARPPWTSARGFTLVEMAIGMLVIALLIGSILVPLQTQVEQRKISETEKALSEIREALVGYALMHGNLPCPAISALDGTEDRTTGVCTGGKRQGFLPWATLGTPKLDSWGRIFHYSVTPAFANSTTKFTLATARDISIQTRDDAGNPIALSNADDIPAVVSSFGRNGYWGTMENGSAIGDVSPANADEDANGNGTGEDFFSRTATQNTAVTGGEFDDLVTWLSPSVLFARMVAAGRLP